MTAGNVHVLDRTGDLIDALAARKSELGLSNSFVEDALHMGENNLDKLLGPSRSKNLTVIVAHDLAELFGCRITLTIDPELAARMQTKYEQRDARKVHPSSRRVSQKIMELAKPLIHKAMSAAGGRARAASLLPSRKAAIAQKGGRARMRKLTKAQRSELAGKAAKARWAAAGASP